MVIFDVVNFTEEITIQFSSISETFRFKYQVIVNSSSIKCDKEEMSNDEIFKRLVSLNMNRPQV